MNSETTTDKEASFESEHVRKTEIRSGKISPDADWLGIRVDVLAAIADCPKTVESIQSLVDEARGSVPEHFDLLLTDMREDKLIVPIAGKLAITPDGIEVLHRRLQTLTQRTGLVLIGDEEVDLDE